MADYCDTYLMVITETKLDSSIFSSELECTAITDTRKSILGLQRPYLEDEDRTIAEFLLFGHKTEEMIYMNRHDLLKLWQHRSKIIH